jgi:glycosyltransferase involved in cell wall biosynthesis
VPVTVLVEPNPSGHRFQAVANVAEVAGESAEVVLLTSQGASAAEEFSVYLAQTPVRVVERFGSVTPPTAEVAAEVAALLRAEDVTTVVHMDGDQDLKRWWYVAPRAFRGLPRPRVVFMLTRYPARLKLTDRVGWKLRIPKATLAVAAMATGTMHHVAGFAGRDDMADGWIVRRARDPEICTAHARDRDRLRQELDLPADRVIVGIYGGISERKNSKLVFEAMQVAGIDGDLLLAGGVQPEVWAWIDGLPAEDRTRIIVRDGFLDNDLLDKLVAASDVAPIALTNNGPSGIMGKASAAGVPVVTAGSEVRAKELIATDGGEVAELTAASIGAAIKRVLERDPDAPRRNTVPPATAEEFARRLLGVDAHGKVEGRTPRNRRNRPRPATANR